MKIFPAEKLVIDHKKLDKLKHYIDLTIRLVMFSRQHHADDLLDAYISKTTKLKELLSIKNAQMEAENETEIKEYTSHLKLTLDFINNEIRQDVQFNSELQLFQLFRLVSPDSHTKHPNKYRQNDVQIGRHICPAPHTVPALVTELFYQMKQIENPIIRAIYFHHELIRIHPFVDGNGRTTRMAKNWMLMYKLCPPIFISDALEKKEYIDALGNSFFYLKNNPNDWNNHLELFFDQEMDRVLNSAAEVYNTVSKIGNKRKI